MSEPKFAIGATVKWLRFDPAETAIVEGVSTVMLEGKPFHRYTIRINTAGGRVHTMIRERDLAP